MFTLGSDNSGNPPDGRVVEHQNLNRCLKYVDRIITAADVGQFMHQYQFDLFDSESGQKAHRHQDHRPCVTEHHWNTSDAGLQ